MAAGFPLQLISRRRAQNMNSWLPATTGLLDKPLNAAVEVDSADAARRGIDDGQQVHLMSREAAVEARIIASDRVRSGVAALEQGSGLRLFVTHGMSATEQ